ncbi:MAG: hypothetical protein IJC84_05580 [Clostridia bacterium]|nr:hypothetical protein [Clostridia bacterium]
MLKNKNLLKGITALVAFVLVLGVGVLLHSVAASDNLILYVSTYGDNSNGKDEATAFKTLKDATIALRDMKLSPSTEVTIIVVDKCYTRDGETDAGQEMDGVRVFDSKGNKKLITVTSLNTDSKENFSEIHLNYLPDPYHYDNQNVRVVNDIIFKDIDIVSEVANVQVSDSKGADTQYWAQKRFFMQNAKVTFDNVDLTFSDTNKCQDFAWIYTDFYHPATKDKMNNSATYDGEISLTLIDCDFGNIAVAGAVKYDIPNANLKYTFINSTIGTFHGTRNDCNTITVDAKDSHFYNEFNICGVMDKTDLGRTIHSDVYGMMDGCTMDMNIFLVGANIGGNATFDFNNSNVSGNFIVARNGYKANVQGNVTVNVDSSYFKGNIRGVQGTFHKDVIYNIKGSTHVDGRFQGTYDNGEASHIYGKLINTVYSGRVDNFFGMGGGPNDVRVEGGVYNYFYGGDFSNGAAMATSGGAYGTNTYDSAVYADITNVIKNGPDGNGPAPIFGDKTGSQARGAFAGGNQYPGTLEGDITNYFYGGEYRYSSYSSGLVYGGCFNATHTGNIYNYWGENFTTDYGVFGGTYGGGITYGDIHNTYEGGVFKGGVTGGTGNGHHYGSIYNTVNAGTFDSTFNGGHQNNYMLDGSVTTEVNGGTFNDLFMNGTLGDSKKRYGEITGDLNLTVNGGTFNKDFRLITSGGTYGGDANFTMTGGTIGYNEANLYLVGDSDKVNLKGDINVLITGGTIDRASYALYPGGHSCQVEGKSTVRITDGTLNCMVFTAQVKAPGVIKGGVELDISGGTFTKAVSGGGYRGEIQGNTVTKISGGTFSNIVYGGSMTELVVHNGNHTTSISGGTFNKAVFLGHEQQDASYNGTLNASVTGGTFKDVVKGGGAYRSAEILFAPKDGNITFNNSNPFSAKVAADTHVLAGGEHFICLRSNTKLAFDDFEGNESVKFMQLVNWSDGHTYVTVAKNAPTDAFVALNDKESVVGTATQVADGVRMKLVGGTGSGVIVPTLESYALSVDNDLSALFFVSKTRLEEYVGAGNNWTCTVKSGDKVKAVTFESVSDLSSVADEYVVITLTDILATDYDRAITVTISGREPLEFTVYDLIEDGIDNANTAELEDFLKALHNYGVESENYFVKGKLSLKYPEIAYTDSYTATPVLSESTGYRFYGSSLAMDQKIALNLYLKTPFAEGLTAKVFVGGTEYTGAKVIAKPLSGYDAFNYGVSLSVPFTDMDETFTVRIYEGEAEVASYTGSVANVCAAYVDANADCKDLAEAVLTLFETAKAAF